MVSVLIAGRIAPHGRVHRSVGHFSVNRHAAGRYGFSAPGLDLAFGRVIPVITSDKGVLAHYVGLGHRGEIHTVRSDDGSYVDADFEFVFYQVA